MGRTHAQQFANHVLPRALFADPVTFTRAIGNGTAAVLFISMWREPGDALAPVGGGPRAAITGPVARRGLSTIAHITPPAPRESGDAAAIVVVGRGDGDTRLSTVAYYVVELVIDGGMPRFAVVTRTGREERGTSCGAGPLPDPRWIADDIFERYAGRTPAPRLTSDVPALPSWYWWYLLEGLHAIRAFADARDESERCDVIRELPVLLLPELVEAAEQLGQEAPARRLRELRPYLRRDATMAGAWQALVHRLSSLAIGAPLASTLRTLPLIAEAAQHGALTRAQAYEAEAVVRSRLAALGLSPTDNHELAQQLFAAARAAERSPRMARGTASPVPAEDPVWKPLFLDEADLPDCALAGEDESLGANDPVFAGHGGLRAGYCAWVGDESTALARLSDTRWVFRTSTAAAYYLRAVRARLGDGLPALAPPALGDEALAWGGETPRGRTQIVVVRVGRVIARLAASEGMYAAASRQILHAAMLHPLAGKIVQRARQGVAAYWLAVVYPTNAVPALLHSPGFDTARLLAKYPLLALADLPAAMTTLGESYAPAARSLASFQAQVRAHRWSTYREAMLGLVRALLTTDMGDMRVNAAHAHEIVTELRCLDPDPIWQQLDAECVARA